MPMQDFEKRIERRTAIRTRMDAIDKKILILSGKGGVGKTTVTVKLAYALAKLQHNVGILDIDLHGPNVAKMVGVPSTRFEGTSKNIIPIQVQPNLSIAGIDSAMKQPEDAVVWRGPMKNLAIQDLLASVDWGVLDWLVIDTPPGTGDEHLAIISHIPELTGAIIVTTAQEVALLDARRSILFCRKMGVAVLGVVENMSMLECPHCHNEVHVFGSNGGEKLAREMGVAFLGSIPLEVHDATSKPLSTEQSIPQACMDIAVMLAQHIATTVIEGSKRE